jgi:pyrroloquinoline quinone biosynthesis protein B
MGARIIVLGSGQDGGVPQPGCRCPGCGLARRYARHRRLAPSIAVYDSEAGFCYLIDASPDLGRQLDMIPDEVSGIFLTHAHIGHYTGLLMLGREVLDAEGVPVYCTSLMKEFLARTPPFSLLARDGNIALHEVRPDREIVLDGLTFTPVAVPHRGEITDTVGYVIGAGREAAYIPDTDRWTPGLIETISNADVALIDGTFYSRAELPRFEAVPHPPIEESLPLFAGVDTEIYFTHINHTNPVNAPGPERRELKRKGLGLARDGLILNLDM